MWAARNFRAMCDVLCLMTSSDMRLTVAYFSIYKLPLLGVSETGRGRETTPGTVSLSEVTYIEGNYSSP
jgi:hypothetical protein